MQQSVSHLSVQAFIRDTAAWATKTTNRFHVTAVLSFETNKSFGLEELKW